jgi:hypothetical protein
MGATAGAQATPRDRHHAAMSDAARTASGFVSFVTRISCDSFMLRS